MHVRTVLRGVSGLDFVYLSERDVVRNPLVQRIVRAYERHDDELQKGNGAEAAREVSAG